VTPRPEQPEPFLRGAPYPAYGDVPYPRANPTDTARLPADIWHASVVPVGVRIELTGDSDSVDVGYRTSTGNLGYRGDGAGITFSVWRAGRQVCEEEATLGEGMVRLTIGPTAADKPATIYLPEGMHPLIQSVMPVDGDIAPAPRQPRWVAYGDSVTQGWIASGPSQAWTAIAARKAGLDLVNLGYAGSARGEIVSAEHVADLEADIITIAYGVNCWARTPHTVGMVTEGMRGFLGMVRTGHPETPIVVMSPLVRPDAEEVPNRLGASLAALRAAMESVVHEHIDTGDDRLWLVKGLDVLTVEHLDDGIHPGDEGHKRIAATIVKALNGALKAVASSNKAGDGHKGGVDESSPGGDDANSGSDVQGPAGDDGTGASDPAPRTGGGDKGADAGGGATGSRRTPSRAGSRSAAGSGGSGGSGDASTEANGRTSRRRPTASRTVEDHGAN